MAFTDDVRTWALLGSDRRCCLCKKSCGVNIEVHHIDPEADGGSNELDNAMPLCFECHGAVSHYNAQHPVGTKYKQRELRERRNQVYREFTRHLVPRVFYNVTQELPLGRRRSFPDVGFMLDHQGDSLPVLVRTEVGVVLEDGRVELIPRHYAGERLWNLNPGFLVSGHFQIPKPHDSKDTRLRVVVTVIPSGFINFTEFEGWQHRHLPIEFVYNGTDWVLDP